MNSIPIEAYLSNDFWKGMVGRAPPLNDRNPEICYLSNTVHRRNPAPPDLYKNPVNHVDIFTISAGAGFLPSRI